MTLRHRQRRGHNASPSMTLAGSSAPKNKPEGKRKPRISPKQGRALLRRSALIRIGHWRHANGVVPSDFDDVALAIADTAVFAIDGRIKETYISGSQSRKTKRYDMYSRVFFVGGT
jgi:hypothetical protein